MRETIENDHSLDQKLKDAIDSSIGAIQGSKNNVENKQLLNLMTDTPEKVHRDSQPARDVHDGELYIPDTPISGDPRSHQQGVIIGCESRQKSSRGLEEIPLEIPSSIQSEVML